MSDWDPATQLSNATQFQLDAARDLVGFVSRTPSEDLARMGDVLEQLFQNCMLTCDAYKDAMTRALQVRTGWKDIK